MIINEFIRVDDLGNKYNVVVEINEQTGKECTTETYIPTEEELHEILKPTLEEQIEGLKQDNLILMDALATVFEEILMLGGTV